MELTVVVSISFLSVRQKFGSRSPQKKKDLGVFFVLGKETCFFPYYYYDGPCGA